MNTELKIGDRVEAGKKGTEDYDSGRVDAINGDDITVSWDSLVVTTQTASLLHKVGIRYRYELTTSKGSMESDTLEDIDAWQSENQGAFASLEDRRDRITISVDDIDFLGDGSSVAAMMDALVFEART